MEINLQLLESHVHMGEGRVNKHAFAWGDRKAGRGCKIHNFHVKENFRKLGFEQFSDIRGSFSRNTLLSIITEALTNDFIADWYIDATVSIGPSLCSVTNGV